MAVARNVLIVLADGEHARFVRPAEDYALHTQSIMDASKAGVRSNELGSDRPGAAFHSGAAAHHTIEPRHDPHRMAKEAFARAVADLVTAAVTENPTLELVLVAPSHTLAILEEHLSPAGRSQIIGTLAKDLVKTPDHLLQPHLKQWIRPIHHVPL